jgi:hypothetical protein
MDRQPTTSNDGDFNVNPQIQNKSKEANYITGHRINPLQTVCPSESKVNSKPEIRTTQNARSVAHPQIA